MQNINIHNAANINAEGKRESKNCKPVICIETGRVFASATDAAEHIGVHSAAMSLACTGKVKTCKGMHFFYMNAALENLDAVMARLRQACAMEEDAQKWRAHKAAEERKIVEANKAKELYDKAVAKAEAKVVKYAADCAKYQEKLNESMSALDEANKELEALIDKGSL